MVGQLPSKPRAGNVFLKVPEKEDLREKRERIGRGRGRALGERRVAAGFTGALEGRSVFAASAYVMLTQDQKFGLRSLQPFIPKMWQKRVLSSSH